MLQYKRFRKYSKKIEGLKLIGYINYQNFYNMLIDGDKFIALAGDEEGTITYKNGKLKIELSDGDYIAFKK